MGILNYKCTTCMKIWTEGAHGHIPTKEVQSGPRTKSLKTVGICPTCGSNMEIITNLK